ncbi:filamentous hemagglutinin N-terminal domain-containing protein [Burkholderia sp. Ac-20353]|uniref:two-partner secretion domain-containing protein n=1 Tax=Burkholderia sp. Ac-20353 TaxID=2703894 RepID=UPI00197BB39A|nr:filamentous hemagglutinin N-terminal domain-containing protein [Burkholderia sp. Ac-20353]MBN3787653.1 filamentous hemagglutinin N-terminal domain-containing protein [Burkholderia sp. Ac-20353]
MNKTYALVWNPTQRCWAAVGETARRRGKSSGRRQLAAAVSLLGFAALPAFALPSGETIMSGKADIARAPDGKSMNIDQHSDKLITNWQDFSVAGGERVAFNQPTSQSLALNRVIGNKGSQIDGQISANGRVFLVNPNGVMFGSGAQVNVGGLVASTQNISDDNFLAGNYRFSGNSTQSIVNDGTITAADGGSVALLGARVSNHGVIQAKMGRVVLGAGNAFNVNFDGNGLLSVQVDGGAVDAQANNGGLLQADGGEVLMTARAAGNLLDAVVNNTGKIEARGLSSRSGKITLDGGTVKVAGTLDASAAEAGAPAGSVTTRGERVDVANDTVVDTRAGNTAGTWTIEAANAGVNVAGRSISADTLSRNLGTTNVELANTQGDLTVGGPVAWNSDNALTLTSKKGNVDLQQTLSATGSNARLFVNAANQIRVNDAVKLTGRNAHLELNAKNGHTLTTDKAVVTLSGDNASFRSNGEDYKVLHTLADLRNVDQNLNGRYVLGNAIDGNDARFRSIGGRKSFNGVFDGLGNTIGRLSIYNTMSNVGLFATNTGRISNLALQRIKATAAHANDVVGALTGFNAGTVSNVAARDVTVESFDGGAAGGLVGYNAGAIAASSAAGMVKAGDMSTAGGLAGYNIGRIESSRADGEVVTGEYGTTGGLVGRNFGTISASRAGSNVTGGDRSTVGGLVGENNGKLDRALATGNVRAGSYSFAGGLVGSNRRSGNIDASVARGNVQAGFQSSVGGLSGSNWGGIGGSSAEGTVTAGDESSAGGLVGTNGVGVIDSSSASGDVRVGRNSAAGGLAGTNWGGINGSRASGKVTAGAVGHAGGLVGDNMGSIRRSQASGDVSAGNHADAGGLVGNNAGIVIESSAQGNVRAGSQANAGGLVGASQGHVTQSDASGNVVADSRSRVGGLVGTVSGTVSASTATGSAYGGYASYVGGLVGVNWGTVKMSASSGMVFGDRLATLGGLVGVNHGYVGQSSTSSYVMFTGNAGQTYGALAGINEGQLVDNTADPRDPRVPLVGSTLASVQH